MKELIVAWQDAVTRAWFPVARLGRLAKSGNYYFVYTKGAKESPNFEKFGRMTDLDAVYVSDTIFPLFANRILPKSRPEYKSYIRWLGLEVADVDDLEILGRTGGTRATDKLELFPCPTPTENGQYVGHFFVHGLRYLLPEHVERLNELRVGDRLFVTKDLQNPADRNALLLRTGDPLSFVGYCPRYLAAELGEFINIAGAENFRVEVEQVNVDAPYDLRVLCKVQTPWPEGHEPCSRGHFEPLFDLKLLRKWDAQRDTKQVVIIG